jgi:hypothetical protein
MADQEGNKTGGRVAGTPNKRTIDFKAKAEKVGIDLAEFLLLYVKGDRRALGYECAWECMKREHRRKIEDYERLLKEFESKTPEERAKYVRPKPPKDLIELTEQEIDELNLIPLDERKEAALELLPYEYPKRKSVEVEVNDNRKTLTLRYAQRGKKPDVEV